MIQRITQMALVCLVFTGAVTLGGCISLFSDFDDLKDETWIHEAGEPNGLQSNTYPTAFAFGGGSGVGTDFLALGRNPSNVALLNFNAAGDLRSEARPTPDGFNFDNMPARPPTAGLAGSDGNQSLIIGLSAGTTGGVGIYSADALASSVTVVPTSMIPTGVALAPTNAGGPGNDIIAVGSGAIEIYAEGNQGTTPTQSCTLTGASNVISGDFLPSMPGDELALAVGDQLQGFDGSVLTGSLCPAGVAFGGGNGETDFGQSLAVGDFDGNGQLDIAAAAPSANRVYLFFNITMTGTTSTDMIDGEASFGSSIAIGDLDGDGLDELIVGVPTGTADGVSMAGRVDIFKFTGTTPQTPVELTRAEPESNETFGATVGIATFGGNKDLLLVSGNKRLFVNFRHPLPGDTDPR